MSEEYKPTEIDYSKYIASVIECEEKQDSSIQHEWLFSFRNEAIKVCNYLKGRGYKSAYFTERTITLGIVVYYVGVPFNSLKNKQ